MKTERPLMFSDFMKATAVNPAPDTCVQGCPTTKTCVHDKNDIRDIHFTLVTRSKGESKLYEAFCGGCGKIVYGQTGAKRVPWTTDRDKAYSEE
jgi:hypothetical protein